jgi:hypothetical protein
MFFLGRNRILGMGSMWQHRIAFSLWPCLTLHFMDQRTNGLSYYHWIFLNKRTKETTSLF